MSKRLQVHLSSHIKKRMITAVTAVAVVLGIGIPTLACLWDHDTLAMERRQFPTVLELITGKFLRHSPAYYQWRVEDRKKRIEKNRQIRIYTMTLPSPMKNWAIMTKLLN